MKMIIALMIATLIILVCIGGTSLAENATVDYVVEYINEQAKSLEIIDSCFYSKDANVVVMKLYFGRTLDDLNSLDYSTRKEMMELYESADKILVDSLEMVNCSVPTQTIAFTSDGQAFFIAINGVNLTDEILN